MFMKEDSSLHSVWIIPCGQNYIFLNVKHRFLKIITERTEDMEEQET
jgi:hypothetical protein